MIGRYIDEENYYKLGLDRNEEFNKCDSKTLLVILEEDVGENYTFALEQRMDFASNMCKHHPHTLNGIVEHAQKYGERLSDEYEVGANT